MARAPAAPQVESVSRPVYGGGQSDDMTSFAGDLLNYSNSQAILGANEGRFADYQRRQDYAENQNLAMQQAQLREQTIKDTARKTPVELMREEAEVLKERMNLFNMAAQLKSATMQQDAREADYQLAEPLAQLASYVGTQNWGSVYAQRKALVANPLYAKSREVRARLEAIDQMLPSWGSAYNSRGESRNFMDVAKEAESPDWATRKEALRILALKSENAQGFVFSHPNLTPTQSAELLTFIRANPLVSDEMKIGQLRQFEQTFNQKLLESTGGDYQEFLRQLGSPETQRQKQDAMRALLYGKGSDEPNYVDSSDRMLDGDSLEQLRFYINDSVENSAGLSITRLVSDGADFFRKNKNLSAEDLAKVTPPQLLQTINWSDGEILKTIGNVAGDATAGAVAKYGVSALVKLPAKTLGTILKAAGPRMISMSDKLIKFGSSAASKGALAAAGAKIGLSGTGVGLIAAGVMDVGMYKATVGVDMKRIDDSMKTIKEAQILLQGSAARGEAPQEMNEIMNQLFTAIGNVNTIAEKHGVKVKLDLNNVVSKQMAYRLQGKKALDQTMSEVYGVPQMPDPRQNMRVQYQPQQPTVAVGPGVSADPWAAMGPATPQ